MLRIVKLSKSFLAQPAKMRIAVVSETYPPQINGVARSIGYMVNGLVGLGHTVQLIFIKKTVIFIR